MRLKVKWGWLFVPSRLLPPPTDPKRTLHLARNPKAMPSEDIDLKKSCVSFFTINIAYIHTFPKISLSRRKLHHLLASQHPPMITGLYQLITPIYNPPPFP